MWKDLPNVNDDVKINDYIHYQILIWLRNNYGLQNKEFFGSRIKQTFKGLSHNDFEELVDEFMELAKKKNNGDSV